MARLSRRRVSEQVLRDYVSEVSAALADGGYAAGDNPWLDPDTVNDVLEELDDLRSEIRQERSSFLEPTTRDEILRCAQGIAGIDRIRWSQTDERRFQALRQRIARRGRGRAA